MSPIPLRRLREPPGCRPRRHVVVFARLPRLGAVKRRLAAGVGASAALRFYRDTTARVLRRLARDRRWTCWLAVTPDRAARLPPAWRAPWRRLPQGAGDLGRRMARPFAVLPRGSIVIVGSDIPDMAPGHIAAAFRALAAADIVVGPAEDGGYWLIGARRLPHGIFAGVRWSSAHALADTLVRVPRDLAVARAARLDDIDDAAALAGWRARRRSVSASGDAPAGAA